MADYNKIQNNRKKEWVIKTDKDLKKTIDEVRKVRFTRGLDENELISYNQLLKAAFRFDPLIDILKKADIKKDNDN